MTDNQMKIVGAFCLALTALLLGYNIDDITRVLVLLLGMG